MIVNDHIRELVKWLEDSDPSEIQGAEFAGLLRKLVSEVRHAGERSETLERYQCYGDTTTELSQYPLDRDGYAQAFDPLVEEEAFYECWRRYGIVVGKAIASKELCDLTIDRLRSITQALSDGACDLYDPSTHTAIPLDAEGVPLISRGFFEIYHDDALAQIRQLVRLYIHNSVIWGRADLWTSFDRIGVKLPDHTESAALPLHVDQNPLQHPKFQTTQGVLALTDCPKERGTFVGVPGSKFLFPEYARFAGRGEYVAVKTDDELGEKLHAQAQALPIRAGDVVTWDSRTTHSNSANISGEMRVVAYVAAGPVPENETQALRPRQEALRTGLGSNVRDSLMHASMRPRYTNAEAIARVRKPEQLTKLGKLLYGEDSYRSVE